MTPRSPLAARARSPRAVARIVLSALAALIVAPAAIADPAPGAPAPPALSPAQQVAQAAAAAAAAARRPPHRQERERVAGAASLTGPAGGTGRAFAPASADTFLLSSSSFDVVAGGCDPRGWVAEDRSTRVFAHVSDRFTVNRAVFGWTPATAPLVFPAPIAGTPISVPRQVAANDSGIVFYVEGLNDGARIVAVYPGQNVMRTYATLPTFPGVDRGFHVAHNPATGGLVVGSAYGNGNGAGLLYHVPAGGGTPVKIAGYGFTRNDAYVHDAALETPEEIVTDAAGNIYFSEVGSPPSEWPRVRMMRASDSTIVTLAGRLFFYGDQGDGGPGVDASLSYPRGLALNAAEDTLYILDGVWSRVRSLSLTTGIIDALPGAQGGDFRPPDSRWWFPYNLTVADGRLYLGCYNGLVLVWAGGALEQVAGGGNSLAEPEDAALGRVHDLGGTVGDLCPAPGGGVALLTDRALVMRLDPAHRVSVIAGVHDSLRMGERALWFGADQSSAPDEVANWVEPRGYGSGWGQRLTSPAFSFADHPNARLTFDMRLEIAGYHELHEVEAHDGFLAVRGLKADGSWVPLWIQFRTDPRPVPDGGARLNGEEPARCVVDLAGAPLAGVTRLQFLVQTVRFGSNEDGFGTGTGAGALLLDNVRLADGGDVLPPIDFEDGSLGGWSLSAVNAPYGPLASGEVFIRDFPPPATEVALRTGFDYSDPSCVWTFTSAGDSVRNGVYARITSPWLAPANPLAPTFISLSGKLATDNQKRYLKVYVRGKNTGETRPSQLLTSHAIFSSGTSGGDLASPYLSGFTLTYPDEFETGTKSDFDETDSIQVVLQIEDRLEEASEYVPQPRVPSRLPYLDDIRVYQLTGDADGDGVADREDGCPDESAAGRDANGDGCVDAHATLRHVETWDLASRPIRVRLTERGDPAIGDGSDLQAVRDAIAAWTSVSGADVPLVEDPPTAQTDAAAMDGVNLVTWDDELQFSPDVLAVTPTTSFTRRGAFDDAIVLPGQIVDSDLIFNGAARYRTATTGPIPNSVDLRSVATHELGHLLGISHSGIAEATMFPVLPPGEEAATLEDDDRAAVGAAYPGAAFATITGAITGVVRRGSTTAPIPGALVTAWSLDAFDQPVRGVACDYTDEAGGYALRGLSAGRYAVRVEPLDGSVPALIPAAINARVLAIAQTNFTAEWWSDGDDGVDDPTLITPVVVVAGDAESGRDVVTSIDVTPPEVAGVLPADGAAGVDIAGRVLVNFSEPVEAATLADAFALRRTGDSGRLGGQAQILNGNRTFIFTPDDLLQFETSYEIRIDTDLTDRQGVHLASPVTTHFTTPATPAVAIFDIQPRQAPPGAFLTIRGHGFTSAAQFEWQSVEGPVITSGGTVTTPQTVLTRLDDAAVSGPVRIIVGSDTSNAFNLTVLRPDPGVPVAVGAPVPLPFSPSDVALSPEGLSAFAVGDGGLATVNLSPTRPGYRVADFQALPGARRAAMARDGVRLFVTRPDSLDLVEVDADTTSAGFGHAFVTIPLPGVPGGLFAAPDGRRVFVTEDAGPRVWTVDVDPASATYRGVVREDTVGAALTGGIGISAQTATALAAAAAGAPRPPRTLTEPYSELYLTSDRGILAYHLYDRITSAYDPRPCADNLETTFDGNVVIAVGVGPAEGVLTRSCLGGWCPGVANPLATLGGRPRDVAANPRTGGLFVVNSLAGQLQVLRPSGTGYALGGVAATGRSPVALAVDASGSVTVVANAGDRTLGIYGVGTSAALASVQPAAAFPGDQVVVRLASGISAGRSVDVGSGPMPADYARDGGLAFAVPGPSPRAVNVSLEGEGERTLSLPLEVVDPIAALAPRPTGRFMLAPPGGEVPEGPAQARTLAVSRDGRSLASVSEVRGAFPRLRLFQLRDDAPEPLYAALGETYVPYFETAGSAAFSLDGRRLWRVSAPGAIHDYDVDPASPFFFHSNDSGFLPGDVFAVAADPIMPRFLVTARPNDQPYFVVDVYDESHDHLGTIDFSIADSLLAVAVSPDGRVLLLGGLGRAFFVDLETRTLYPGSPSPFHAGAGAVVAITATGDGRRALGVFRDGSYAVWSLEAGAVGQELHFGRVAAGVSLGGPIPGLDPHSVLAGGSDGKLWRIDPAGAVPAASFAALAAPAPTLARTPDGRHLFAAGFNPGAPEDTIRVYAMSEATAIHVVSGAGQEALAGEPLPLPVRVRLSDASGRPQSGALVEFSLADAAHGSIEGGLTAEALTDLGGAAEVVWRMPATIGPVSLTVRAPGLPIAPLAVGARSSEDASTAAPSIVAFGPPSGATGIAAGGEVFVRFSQAMDSALTVPTVTLRVGTDVVPGAYRIDDGGRAVFFKPAEPLPYLASCVLEAQAGAVDREGQDLVAGGSAAFTVQAEPTLGIAVLSPPAGPPGAAVTLNGQGFSPVPSLNTVSFNGVPAPVLSAAPTAMIVRVPAGAASGDVRVQVASATSNGLPFVVLPENATPGSVIDSLPTPPEPLRLVITPDGGRAYVVSPAANVVAALDIFSAQEIAVIPVGANPRGIAMLPDGSRAYVVNRDGGDVSIVGTDPGAPGDYHRVVGTLAVGLRPVAVAVLSAGPRVIVVCEGDSTARVIDAERGNATFDQVIKNVPLPSTGGNITVTPDGTRAFILTADGISVLDLQSFVIKNIPLPSTGGNITVSPDGGLLFVVTLDQRLLVIDVAPANTTANRVIKNIPLPSTGGNITVTPDGTRLFVTLPDAGTVLVFQIEPGASSGDGSSTSPSDPLALVPLGTFATGVSPGGVAADPFDEFALVANRGSSTLTLVQVATAAPEVEVQFPNGGEMLLPDVDVTLRWSTARLTSGQSVDLSVSRDLGTTWEPIATGIDNDGEHSWRVTGPSSSRALLRIEARNVFGNTGADVSDAPFTIRDAPTAALLHSLAAAPAAAGIELRWRFSASAGIVATAVERAEAEQGPWAEIPAAPRPEGDEVVALDAGARPGRTYWYRLAARFADGAVQRFGPVAGVRPVTEFALEPVTPNPSVGAVAISFAVARADHVRLAILDVAGRRVATLADGLHAPGIHRALWSGERRGGRAEPGVYFARYEAGGRTFVRRFVLAR